MAAPLRAFPIARGIRGMNDLARFLNASDLAVANIEFDDPTDAEPTWRRYCDRRASK